MEHKTVTKGYSTWEIPYSTPKPQRLGAIDIGTNTLLFACVEWKKNLFQLLCDKHRIARIGEGLGDTGRIQQKAVERAVPILEEYLKLCKQYQCDMCVAVGTSAFRRATNGLEIAALFERILQFPVKILTGEEEAALTYIGSIEVETPNSVLSTIDIGGGSTEIATGCDWTLQKYCSLEIGAVRLTEQFFSSLPPNKTEQAAARSKIQRHFQHIHWNTFGELFAVGGTPTTLAALALQLPFFDPQKVHGTKLYRQQLEQLERWLLAKSLEELRSFPAIHPERADILPAGAMILTEFLRYASLRYCIVSARGLRFGVLVDIARTIAESRSTSMAAL